jgi:hypothetical protein
MRKLKRKIMSLFGIFLKNEWLCNVFIKHKNLGVTNNKKTLK